MNNGRQPAMPFSDKQQTEFGPRGNDYNGLTKREHFAALAMQGFCATGELDGVTYEQIANASINAADALLAALDK